MFRFFPVIRKFVGLFGVKILSITYITTGSFPMGVVLITFEAILAFVEFQNKIYLPCKSI